MRLIFIDESARDDAYYFFGALIADAGAIRSIERGLDGIAELISNEVRGFDSATEFHAVEMFHGTGPWRSVPIGWRVKACRLVAKVLARSSATFVFRGIDLEAHRARYRGRAFPPHEITLAQLLESVDERLGWIDRPDRLGLVLADEHHGAAGARRSLRNFKVAEVAGYTSRPLTRIADTIYFGPSHESRMLQAADVATYFLNRTHTIEETDPRSERAMDEIVGRIRSITCKEYIWRP